MWAGLEDEELLGQEEGENEEDEEWTQEIPKELVEWGEWEAERDALENESAISIAGAEAPPSKPARELPPPPASSGVPPPSLPAQLEKGPLNHAAYVTQGSGDDNSILPKPDHSVINHLAASPIKGGFLSVGVTTRYKRKVSESFEVEEGELKREKELSGRTSADLQLFFISSSITLQFVTVVSSFLRLLSLVRAES